LSRPKLASLALAALALTACGDRSGLDDFFAAGADSAGSVASYYDALAGLTLDSWRDQAALNALLGLPASATPNQSYQERVVGLKRRAELAHQLSDLYLYMTKSRDAAGIKNVTAAGEQLGKSLQGVPSLPGAADIDSNAFGSAAAFFVDLQRQKDLRRGLKALDEVLAGLKTLYERERGSYERISRERNETAEHLLRTLADKNVVDPTALLKTLPLGAAISDSKTPMAPGRAAGLAIAQVDVLRAGFAWDCATEENGDILTAWIEAHKQAAGGTSPDVRPLRRHIARATGCLADYKEIARVH
jgi:hypothetical protein